jgi:hypothetical protein
MLGCINKWQRQFWSVAFERSNVKSTPGLLSAGGDRVEADVAVEAGGGAGQRAADAERKEPALAVPGANVTNYFINIFATKNISNAPTLELHSIAESRL